MPKEKYYLYREDGTEDIKVIKYKDNEMKFIRSQEPISATERNYD